MQLNSLLATTLLTSSLAFAACNPVSNNPGPGSPGTGGGTRYGHPDTLLLAADVSPSANIDVGDLTLTPSSSAQSGKVVFYNTAQLGGETVYPMGATAGDSSIILSAVYGGGNLDGYLEDSFGIGSDHELTTSNSNLGSLSFVGNYAEAGFDAQGVRSATSSGVITLETSADASTLTGTVDGNTLLSADTLIAPWDPDGYYELEGSQTHASALIFGGQDVVGAYSNTDAQDPNIALVRGVFAATTQ